MLVEAQPPVESLVAPLALASEGLPCQKSLPVSLLGRCLGPNSIEKKCPLENPLEKPLEIPF